MANNITTNPRLWDLDTVGSVKNPGYKVHVKAIHFEPAAVDNVCEISEYAADGSTASKVVRLKAGPSAVLPIDLVYPKPLEFNGMYLSTMTAGHVFLTIERVEPIFTA